jgi:hypothetical protein
MSIRVASVNGAPPEQTPFQITMISNWEANTFLLVRNGVVQGFRSGVDVGRYHRLVIPAIVWAEPVTAIGDNAFKEKQLNSVVIPEGVVSIGAGAFSRNIQGGDFTLTSMVIPASVTYIGRDAINIGGQGYLTRFAGTNISYKDDNGAITLGSFSGDFPKYYKKNGMKAGKYTYKDTGFFYVGSIWTYSPK